MDKDPLHTPSPNKYAKVGDCRKHIRLQYGLQRYLDELDGGLESFAREIFDWMRNTRIGRIKTPDVDNDPFTTKMRRFNHTLRRAKPDCPDWATASWMLTTADIKGIIGEGVSVVDNGSGVLRLIACPYLVLDPEHEEINESILHNCGVVGENGVFVSVISGVNLKNNGPV